MHTQSGEISSQAKAKLKVAKKKRKIAAPTCSVGFVGRSDGSCQKIDESVTFRGWA